MRNNFSLGLPYAEISVRDYSLNNAPPFQSGLSLVLGSPQRRQFTRCLNTIFLVLGSSYLSAMKILLLGRSQRQEQVQLFTCKPTTENIWCQDVPPPGTSGIFPVLGSATSPNVNSPYSLGRLRNRCPRLPGKGLIQVNFAIIKEMILGKVTALNSRIKMPEAS